MYVDIIQPFFEEHPSVGLILPNGWFGRPQDNVLSFTGAQLVIEGLRIMFDQGETLVLSGDLRMERARSSLVIQGFSSLEWRWKLYGANDWKHKLFSGVQFEFLGQPWKLSR